MILLLLARFLIHCVPLRWWRGSLGRVGENRLKQFTQNPEESPRHPELVSGYTVGPKSAVAVPAAPWMLKQVQHDGGGDLTLGAQVSSERRVAKAVNRATQRLPVEMVCLPRAMAVQWMLRRRGAPSALVFGILPERGTGDIHALHAWVEAGGVTIIGADPTRTYARGLMLVQP